MSMEKEALSRNRVGNKCHGVFDICGRDGTVQTLLFLTARLLSCTNMNELKSLATSVSCNLLKNFWSYLTESLYAFGSEHF